MFEIINTESAHTSTIETEDPVDLCDFVEVVVEGLVEEGHSNIDVAYENMGTTDCGALALQTKERGRGNTKKPAGQPRAVITSVLQANGGGSGRQTNGGLDMGTILGLEIGIPASLIVVAAIVARLLKLGSWENRFSSFKCA